MRIFWWMFLLLLQFPLGMHLSGHWETNNIVDESISTIPNRPFDKTIRPAADQFHKYIDFLKGKRIALVVNQTSKVGQQHLVDTLLNKGCQIQKIFAPEHGFRGKADRGEHIKDGKDPKTGVKIISLYGKNRRPAPALLADVDLVIFDIQDVGVRFYTFTSTMTYMMEACAMAKIPLLILDRPNPLGHYVDGPLMTTTEKSFIGLHPVPIIHGLTVAEYARMINGEGWLRDNLKCELYHVECLNYNHQKFYQLPVKPSPNLPNMHSIYLYPSLCLFEGTDLSVGRGTDKQFQVYGHPAFTKGEYSFKPVPKEGAKHPVQQGRTCKGFDLSTLPIEQLQKERKLNLNYLIDFYKESPTTLKTQFFLKNGFFHKLVGNQTLMQAIKGGKTATAIAATWQADLEKYQTVRKRYLLYKDFE